MKLLDKNQINIRLDISKSPYKNPSLFFFHTTQEQIKLSRQMATIIIVN